MVGRIKEIVLSIVWFVFSALSILGANIVWVLSFFGIPKSLYHAMDNPNSASGPFWFFASILLALVALAAALLLSRMAHISTNLVALLAALIAAFGWCFKRGLTSLENRARLIILEDLSLGKARTRDEIKMIVRRHSWPYRYFSNIYAEALNSLLLEQRIHIEDGRFFLQKPSLKPN
jgi:hypothetical protein